MPEPIGRVANTSITVRSRGTGQEILIAATDLGRVLARLLAGNSRAPTQEGAYLILTHDREVDGRLKELADVTVAIRYAHPTLVQLVLALDRKDESDGDA